MHMGGTVSTLFWFFFFFSFYIFYFCGIQKRVTTVMIVGVGRVGRALQEMGSGQDLLVKRGEPVPLDFEGPILVCTRNDDLDAVLEATPKPRSSGINT
jgi:hypothetical protein